MAIVTVTLNPCIDTSFTVDHVLPNRKLDGREVRDDPGGGGINVARAAGRLGADVQALWSCGGPTGDRLARLLDREQLAHTPIAVRDDTRENLIVLEAASGDQYRFGMPGPHLDPEELGRWTRAVGTLPEDVSHVVFSGSLPPGVPATTYRTLIGDLPAGTRAVIDAKGTALRLALEARPYLVKPNFAELEALAGVPLQDEDHIRSTARSIVDEYGISVLVVSLGRGGALLVTAEGLQRYSAPSVRIESAVGAGDSMVGAMVTALDRGDELDAAVRLGVAAGAAAVTNPGTELCQRADVERLLTQVYAGAGAVVA